MARYLLIAAMIGVGAFAALGVSQAPPESRAARPLVVNNCSIRPLDDIQVPVQVPGVLSKVFVKDGDTVKKGQPLAQVMSDQSEIEVKTKQFAAKNEAPIKQAEAQAEESLAQLDETMRLYEKGVAAKSQVRLGEAKLKVAEHGVEDAKVKRELAKLEAEAAEKRLEFHKVTSPIDGQVVEIYKDEREAVQALDPIMHVIRTDVVRVEGSIDVRQTDRIRTGMRIDVFRSRPMGETILFRGHTAPVLAVKFVDNDKFCVSGGEDGSIIVWNVEKAWQERNLAEHVGAVNALAASPSDTNRIVSGGTDKRLLVHNVATGELEAEIDTGNPILALVLHPENPNICYTGHADRVIRVWDLAKRSQVQTLAGHKNYVTALAISPDGSRLFSTGNDQSVRLWDTGSGKLLRTFENRSSGVHCLGLDPTGSAMLFNNYADLQIRTLPEGAPIANFENTTGAFADVAVFGPVGGLVLAGSEDHKLQLWQPGKPGQYHQRVVRTYEGHLEGISAVDFTRDGRLFASASSDRTVRIWDVPSLEMIAKERKVGRIASVSPNVESGQTRRFYAEVKNDDEYPLVPGEFATIIVMPDLPGIQASN